MRGSFNDNAGSESVGQTRPAGTQSYIRTKNLINGLSRSALDSSYPRGFVWPRQTDRAARSTPRSQLTSEVVSLNLTLSALGRTRWGTVSGNRCVVVVRQDGAGDKQFRDLPFESKLGVPVVGRGRPSHQRTIFMILPRIVMDDGCLRPLPREDRASHPPVLV